MLPAAGDVIGLTNPGAFAIGDTLVGNGSPVVAFPPIPTFSPELFAYLRCPPNQRKPFAKGVEGERAGHARPATPPAIAPPPQPSGAAPWARINSIPMLRPLHVNCRCLGCLAHDAASLHTYRGWLESHTMMLSHVHVLSSEAKPVLSRDRPLHVRCGTCAQACLGRARYKCCTVRTSTSPTQCWPRLASCSSRWCSTA